MSSILTNTSAMVALQNLQTTESNLKTVNNQISTGKKVATAKDNASVWAISTVMNADVQSFTALSTGLSLGASKVATAETAAENVTSLLTTMKSDIVSAQGGTAADQAKIQADINSLKDQITQTVSSAQFNGTNLLDGSVTGSINVLSSLNRDSSGTVTPGYISVAAQDLTTAASGGLDLTTIDVTTDAPGSLTAIDNLINTATAASAAFGTSANQISGQQDFIGKLSDTLTTGIGSLTDANMEAASARLQALQVQQQLGTQALSIANQAPSAILSLFR